MATNQELRLEAFQFLANSTTGTYEEIMRKAFNAGATVPAGATFNEAFMIWLQKVTQSSETSLAGLQNVLAQQCGYDNWTSTGAFKLQIEVGTFGDSYAAPSINYAISAANNRRPARSQDHWTSSLCGIAAIYELANCFGNGGDQTTAQLARVSAMDGFAGDVMIYSSPVNNDVAALADQTTTQNNIAAIVDYINNTIGVPCIITSTIPRVGSTSDQKALTVAHNTYMRSLDDGVNVLFADYYQDMVDSNGNIIAKFVRDGTHLSIQGSRVAGGRILEQLQRRFGLQKAFPMDTSDNIIISNPTMDGTSGTLVAGTSTMTGVVADNWRLVWEGASAATIVASKDADDGSQVIDLSLPMGSGDSELLTLEQKDITTGFQNAKNYEIRAEVEILEAENLWLFASRILNDKATDQNGWGFATAVTFGTDGLYDPTPGRYVIRSYYTTTDATVDITARVHLAVTGSAAAGSCKVKVHNVKIIEVA